MIIFYSLLLSFCIFSDSQPPVDWPSIYPEKLDALDPFFARLNNVPLEVSKRDLTRPRTKEEIDTWRKENQMNVVVEELQPLIGKWFPGVQFL